MSAVLERPSTELVCECPTCRAGFEPLTVEHFCEWAAELTLDTGGPWIVEDFFGLFLEDYFSGVAENWLIVPEGNTKTTSLAGLGGYLLEHRPIASIPWAASSRDQAEIGFRQLEGLVVRSSRLKSVLKCQEGYRRVKNMRTGGRLQVFAADDKTGDGIIPTDAFLDELHRQKDLRLYRTWVGKLLKRGGQLAAISTAGEPGTEFEEARERIRQETPVVERRAGFVRCRSDAISLHEYAVDEGADVDDMEVVKLSNPFSGITVEDLRGKRESPTMTPSHWRRFVCNLATRSDSAAITELEWEAARVGWEPIPEGQHVDVGFDAGWKWDTTAIVPMWFKSAEERVFGVPSILEPPRDGSSLDPQKVKRALVVAHERNPIDTLVMDMSRAEDIAGWAEAELGCDVIDRSQTPQFSVMDYDYFMEAIRSGWIRQPGDPDFTRHVMNAVAQTQPNGETRFQRPATNRGKVGDQHDRRVIDALTAAAMVHSYMAAQMSTPKASGWRGL
jgi:phage terminase large subunit-like protein